MPGQGTVPGAGSAPGEGTPPGAGQPGEPGGYGEPGAGSNGMIGTGPGTAEGEFGSGNTGATGFIGADDVATQPGSDLPMTGGSGGGRHENERYRKAWMAEDVDIWEGETAPARH